MLQKSSPRFFGCLPLYIGNVYISGLTVYISRNGIIRLEAHFAGTSQLSGSLNSCPNYFLLYLSEYIAYAWLYIINSPSSIFAAPILTVSYIYI